MGTPRIAESIQMPLDALHRRETRWRTPCPVGADLGYCERRKSKRTNECILPSTNMHFTTSNGNIRRPSSYPNCSPGTLPTQPMHLPTSARSRCIYPRCTQQNAAQVGVKDRSAAHFRTVRSSRSTQIAACILQRHSLQQPKGATGDARILFIFLHIGPCGAPFALFHSRYLGGATPVSLAFTRQCDLQGTARCPLSYAPRRMTTMTVQRQDYRDFLFHARMARQHSLVGFSVRWDTASEGPLLLSFLLEILDSALSPSIARPALWLAWQKFGDCSGHCR